MFSLKLKRFGILFHFVNAKDYIHIDIFYTLGFDDITITPISWANLTSSSSLLLFCNVSASQPLTYRWFKDDVEVMGMNETYFNKTTVGIFDVGTYKCAANNTFYNQTSMAINITVSDIKGNRITISIFLQYCFHCI